MSSTNIQCIQWGINPPTESSLLQLLKEVVSNGASFTAIDKWYFFGKHLCPYCIRLYNGIWDHKSYKFCPWRYIYDRCIYRICMHNLFRYGFHACFDSFHDIHGYIRCHNRKSSIQTHKKIYQNSSPYYSNKRVSILGIWNDVFC